MNDKSALRHAMREKLRDQSLVDRALASQRICEQLLTLEPDWQRVVVYLAQEREANIDEWARTIQARGVLLSAPHSRESGAPFYPIAPDWSNIELNARGWREPTEYSGAQEFDLREADAILLPGLAFDLTGNRLGQGGGWYDRALENLPAGVLRIGVCFDFQLVETLPREPHDQPVSVIVTDKRILHART